MARYRITCDFAYIVDRIVRKDEIIEWDGPVGSYMEALDEDEDEAPRSKGRKPRAEGAGDLA